MATLGALGVVFGDIGTSPLYAMDVVFSLDQRSVSADPETVFGIVSMVLWTITLVVTVKYVALVTRADNEGEGGILALLALLQRSLPARRGVMLATATAMLGAALFYGDVIITPAISVMSAVEGLAVASPGWEHAVLPTSAVVLVLLFVIQSGGTGPVSHVFGPIMLTWFVVLAALGVPQILSNPHVLVSLSPHWAIELAVGHPFAAFVIMGAVVLTVTGAEALYADLGHFGARAVRRAWLVVAMPALVIVYLGQAALVIDAPETVGTVLFHMAPRVLQLPLVVLATAATIIASQAVISGAFSVTMQAVRLGLLPRLTIRHTSRRQEGQVYLPAVNWAVLAGVMLLLLVFGSSASLAHAYGLAVTGTLVLTSVLFMVFAATVWQWHWWVIAGYAVTIGSLELALLAANATKLASGAWVPLMVAVLVLTVMAIWYRGQERVAAGRRRMEGPLAPFIASLPGVRRIPGVAVFPHASTETTPLALLRCVESFHVLYAHVIIVRVLTAGVPHVRPAQRVTVRSLGEPQAGVTHVTLRVGFMDAQDVPRNLERAAKRGQDLPSGIEHATYFLSTLSLLQPEGHALRTWPKRLFVALNRNQAHRSAVFELPPTRTVVMGSEMLL